MGLIWWFNAPFALLFFVIYSAWHFGETEFSKLTISSFFWGFSLLGVFLFSHPNEFNAILAEMSVNSLQLPFDVAFYTSIVVLTLCQLSKGWKSLWEILWVFLATKLTLLEGFGLFFIFSHSFKSSSDILGEFRVTPIKLFKLALPFSLGAYMLIGLFYYFNFWQTPGIIGLFFIFLSCISFPHVFAMHDFYNTSKAKTA